MAAQLPDPSLPWPIPMEAVALIARAEGLRLHAYRCPAGVPTIGWGHTTGVRMGDTCTKAQADEWLLHDLESFARDVAFVCRRDPSRNELGAMTSLAYNVGVTGFEGSTVLRKHNEGDRQAAARAFALWNKARVDGVLQELAGLTTRRAREAALYLTPDGADEQPQAMPQEVEPESRMRSSPIAQGGAVTAGAGLIGLAGEVGQQVQVVKGPVDAVRDLVVGTLGVPVEWLLPIVLIGAGGLVVYWRVAQRRRGWS